MARLNRLFPVGISQHIIQRSDNFQACFMSEEDMAVYARLLENLSKKYHVEIHAWVFMPDHIHLLVTPRADRAISKLMQSLGRQYSYYFNKTYERTGALWGRRFKSCLVQSSGYLLQCYRYIELNPVRSGLVSDPARYRWSSYWSNAIGVSSSLLTSHEEYLLLGKTQDERLVNYSELFRHNLSEVELDDIRYAVNKNLALGDDVFKDDIEKKFKQRVRLQRAGRKPLDVL